MDPSSAHAKHIVQFYGNNDASLIQNVSRFLAEALQSGGGAIVIARAAHRTGISARLAEDGIDPQDAIFRGRLVLCDAQEALTKVSVAGQPDWKAFQQTIGSLMREMEEGVHGPEIHAYGEMVDLLWNAGHSSAALRLEDFWNRLFAVHRFSLFCAYEVDVFGKEFHASVLDPVLCAHGELVPAHPEEVLDGAIGRAMDDILGSRAARLRSRIASNSRPSWGTVPSGEETVLWLRNHLPEYADAILTRARGYCAKSLPA